MRLPARRRNRTVNRLRHAVTTGAKRGTQARELPPEPENTYAAAKVVSVCASAQTCVRGRHILGTYPPAAVMAETL
jgi:hypothetical protein